MSSSDLPKLLTTSSNMIFKILYFLKLCPIFVGSVHNFGKCLFPLDACMVSWPIWSKNLGRTLSRPLRRWSAFIRFNQLQSLLHYKIAIWTLAKTKIVIIKDNFCPRKHHTERTTGKTSKDCKMGPNPF